MYKFYHKEKSIRYQSFSIHGKTSLSFDAHVFIWLNFTVYNYVQIKI